MGSLVDAVGVAGEVVGKGTEVEVSGGGTTGGGVGGGEGSC